MPADDDDTASLSDAARKAAITQATSTLVYLAIMITLSVAITKRDYLIRMGMRVQGLMNHRDIREQRAARLIAELRRDISRIEHADGRFPEHRRGLYEMGGTDA